MRCAEDIGTGSGGTTPGTTVTVSSNNPSLTQTAQANAGQYAQSTATAQVQASATVSAQSTAGAQSTASAQASATAQVQASATAMANATNPYGGTLALNDPLADNSQGHNWDVTSDATVGSSCQFTNNAYDMIMPGSYGGACLGQATSFSNFAFQAQMTFSRYGQHFSGGGLVFRGSAGKPVLCFGNLRKRPVYIFIVQWQRLLAWHRGLSHAST